MFKIMGTKIFLTRGDSAFIDLTIKNTDGTDYEMQPGDQILLTVKKTTSDKDVIFQRTLADGVIEIRPTDTEGLPFGDYVYDCQLRTYDGITQTFITPSLFRVLEEVTY